MEFKGAGLSILFFVFIFCVIILLISPTPSSNSATEPPPIDNSPSNCALVTNWPYWAALIILGGVLGGLVGTKVLGSGLTGPSESLVFLVSTTGPIFGGMLAAVWETMSAENVPYFGFLELVISAFYGVGLFLAAAEMGGGSGAS